MKRLADSTNGENHRLENNQYSEWLNIITWVLSGRAQYSITKQSSTEGKSTHRNSPRVKLKNHLKTKLLCFNGQQDNGEGLGWTPGMENVLCPTLVIDMCKASVNWASQIHLLAAYSLCLLKTKYIATPSNTSLWFVMSFPSSIRPSPHSSLWLTRADFQQSFDFYEGQIHLGPHGRFLNKAFQKKMAEWNLSGCYFSPCLFI